MCRAVSLLVLTPLLALAGCLGGLPSDPQAELIALAPREALGLPVRGNRPYWLLRAAPGWQGSHEVHLGGGPTDGASAQFRVARFSDAGSAEAAYARLTPAYLHALGRDRMAGDLYPFDYPQPLAGDDVAVYLFDMKLLPGQAESEILSGQLSVLRAGRTVIVVESIGVEPARLVPAVTEAVSTAARMD